MKYRLLLGAVITAISLSAFADNTNTSSTSPTSETDQTIKNLTLQSKEGSAILSKNNNTQASSSQTSSQSSSNASSSNGAVLTDESDRVSYSMGFDIGRTFKRQDLEINPEAIAQGIEDAYSGSKMQMSEKDMQTTLMNFQKELIAKHQSQMTAMSTQNKKDGDAYLAANKAKPGVVTLEDGLQYKIIKGGNGKSPTDSDFVTVNYEGTFPNGQVFDSSYTSGKPVTFPVSEVIKGWSEALKLMKTGATWELVVPPSLAYGERGIGPIGPNQTLVFKIDLLSISSKNNSSNNSDNAETTLPNTNGAVQ